MASYKAPPIRTEQARCFGAKVSRGAMAIRRVVQPQTALCLVWGYWDSTSSRLLLKRSFLIWECIPEGYPLSNPAQATGGSAVWGCEAPEGEDRGAGETIHNAREVPAAKGRRRKMLHVSSLYAELCPIVFNHQIFLIFAPSENTYARQPHILSRISIRQSGPFFRLVGAPTGLLENGSTTPPQCDGAAILNLC